MWGGAVGRRTKKKCAAKPEEHFGNALFALPEAQLSFSRTVTAPQKVQRMTRSQNERLMRWEGAVNGRSAACGVAVALRPRLPSADKLARCRTASPVRYRSKT